MSQDSNSQTTSDAPQRWRVSSLHVDIEADEARALEKAAARKMGIAPTAIRAVDVVKRSFDTRHRPRLVFTADIEVAPDASVRDRGDIRPAPGPIDLPHRKLRDTDARVAIVGAGPGGLFAALTLARAGLRPVLLDRGKPVETRGKDVGALINRGILDPESNLCFGEGGAGTWSDGKLTTRIGAGEIRAVLETLHAFGGPARILTDGKPHLGTDKLVKILKRFRAELHALGVDVRYGHRVDDLVLGDDGAVRGLDVDGQTLEFDAVLLAIGHSARDLYRRLIAKGVPMEQKRFAVGFRVEHPQALINEIQYGKWAGHPNLPTADYRLSANYEAPVDRSVYSFCMCPGGVIMPTATREDEVVVNGMSNATRSGRWANAALVVSVGPDDFARHGEGLLAGAALQRDAEVAASQLGGGAFRAPAQRLTDFLAGRPSRELRKTTYGPGVTPAKLDSLYDAPVIAALKQAVSDFDRRMPGFVTDDAVLHGVETRTSAPLRILRGEDRQSTGVRGLYPVGEGAGYAGGIVSAAVDGIRSADAILARLEA